MKIKLGILILVIGLIWSPFYAHSFEFNINLDLSNVTGHTTYDIKFYENDKYYGRIDYESKLEFDLNATLITLGCEGIFLNEKLQLFFSYGKSVKTHGGTFKDRDWITNEYINMYYDPLMGDTESDIDSDLEKYEFKFRWNILKIKDLVNLFTNFGFEHQVWGTFKPTNLEGYYSGLFSDYGYREYFSDQYSYAILTYDIEYDIYYAGIGAEFNFNNKWLLKLSLDIGSVHAEDVDDHILRRKIAESTADGLYYCFNVIGGINVSRLFKIKTFIAIKTIDAEGTQGQYFYNSNRIPIDVLGNVSTDITSSQTYIGIKGVVFFE